MTEEALLQRVLPFFVVDKEEYSVKWCFGRCPELALRVDFLPDGAVGRSRTTVLHKRFYGLQPNLVGASPVDA